MLFLKKTVEVKKRILIDFFPPYGKAKIYVFWTAIQILMIIAILTVFLIQLLKVWGSPVAGGCGC